MDDSTARIVVGVDGSSFSVRALQEAAKLGAALGLPLHAVITWQWPALGSVYTQIDWTPEGDAKEVLDTALQQAFGDDPPADLTSDVVMGAPASVLVAQSEHAQMIVVGSRGHGGFVGMLLGSVSSAVAQHAKCSVLVVHDRAAK